ncbi:MAG: DUF927 domain-containing protein [Desulfovibrio sp.]|jgi:putative DNA primase/helicase|nr:DUF927 domain-containing protein [Desulfovibrio sp.]
MPALNHQIEAEALAALRDAGLVLESIIWDAGIKRCGTEKKPQGKDGSYTAHSDAPASVGWWNFPAGTQDTWTAQTSKQMTAKERKALRLRIVANQAAFAEEKAKKHAAAAKEAQGIYSRASDCTEHAYLATKGVKPCPGLKIGKNSLIVPLYNEAGALTSLQLISMEADGSNEKKFLHGGKIGGCFFPIGDKDEHSERSLIICEGLATGLSLHQCTGDPVFVAFYADNLLPVAEVARRKYPDRKIVIAADNDVADGKSNTGLEKATKAVEAVGALLAVPSLNGGKCDFNDVHKAEGRDEVFRQYGKARKLEPPKAEMPHGYYFKQQGNKPGLWHREQGDDGKDKETWLSGPFEVLGKTRDTENNKWGLWLQWKDDEGVPHKWAMPKEQLVGRDPSLWRSRLADGGLSIGWGTRARGLLNNFFMEYRTDLLIRCVDRTGWHDDVYVFPNTSIKKAVGTVGTVGTTNETNWLNSSDNDTCLSELSELPTETTVLQVSDPHNPFKLGGTLDGWRDTIGALARGNSRMMLAICASFAAVLLEPAGQESGGFNFVGQSSIGKSTALAAAGSVWGKGILSGGFVNSWRATANGLEGLAALHSDALLALDELSQVTGHGLREASYMLANGSGKTRSRQDGSAKASKSWRIMFLSTGEIGLADKLNEEGFASKAGQEVRLVDIPADAGCGLGLFEDLHEHKDACAFADAIKQAGANDYGHAARAFIQNFADNREDATRDLKNVLNNGVSLLCADADADGQVKRVATRFLLCAAAGEMAVKFGLLPWCEGEALAAVKKCFDAWLESRGGSGAAEDREILSQVRLFIEQHGASRFQDIEKPEERCISRVGFRKIGDGETTYFVLPVSWKKEVCKGLNAARAARVLCKKGILLKGEGRNFTKKYSKKIKGIEKPRFYTLVFKSVSDELD